MNRYASIFIQVLIFLSVLQFTFETVPGLSEQTLLMFQWFEWFCVAVFTVEYFYRLKTAEKKLRFVFSFMGLIDLLAILPFYLGGTDLRSLRALRFFRLLRILKLVRYLKALDRIKAALLDIKEELVLFMFFSLLLIYFAGAGIWYFEHQVQPENFSSIPSSLWWAVATLTTVGYGDVYPVTAGGKIFTAVILFIGLGIVSIPSGLIASAFQKRD